MTSNEPLEPAKAEATGYTPGDDGWTRWRNFFSVLTGQMTDAGKAQYRHDRDVRHEATDCERCEKYRDFVLAYSPTVRFVGEHINKLHGNISADNTHCMRCENQQTGGFDPKYGIVLCANHLRNQAHLEETLSHEMLHAYDHLRYQVDWQNNLRHAACTEIRASSLSGECKFWREFWTRGQWKLAKQHQECVRRRAVLSVMARPACKNKDMAQQVVDEVWDSCFTDTRPFDEIYR